VVRARPALLSPLLPLLGVAGIYSPFTGEAHFNTRMPRVAHPFTACHELAHQRGVAREDEANFVAWVVCRASTAPHQRYSGNLLALSYALVAWYGEQPDQARAELGRMQPGVRSDLEQLWGFWEEHRSPLTAVAHETNDLFLRGQGEPRGARSYGGMVDLLLAWRRGPRD